MGRIDGFSLIETLVATTLMATVLVGLAHLLAMSTRANQTARSTTVAAILASEQLEILYSEPARAGEAADGQDFLDATGRSLGSGLIPPVSAAFIRRWSTVPLAADPDRLLLVQVLVIPIHGRVAEEGGSGLHRTGAVRLVSVKRRRSA
jgi:type II secretory pathway pseudopilin PulG